MVDGSWAGSPARTILVVSRHQAAARLICLCLAGLIALTGTLAATSALAGQKAQATPRGGNVPVPAPDATVDAPRPRAEATTPDDAVIEAVAAWRSRNRQRLEQVAPRTRGHVLAGWVEYWQYALVIDSIDAATVQGFLARESGSLAAERLRADWLRALGRRADWTTLSEEAKRLTTHEDIDLECLVQRARLQAGDVATVVKPAALLALPRALPEQCAVLMSAGQRNGSGVTSEQAWQRAHLMTDAGSLAGVQQALSWLPAGERPEPHLLNGAWNSSAKFVTMAKLLADQRASRELLLIAFTRLARAQPQVAASLLDQAQQKRLGTEAAAFVAGQIGLASALNHHTDAMTWFALADESQLSNEQWAWRARAALRESDWSQLATTIDHMPTALRAEATWIYWSGRALAAQGRQGESRAAYERIAIQPHFYGLLAAEELGRPLALPVTAVTPSDPAIAAVGQDPAVQRAVALFRVGLRSEAVREWIWAARGADARRLLAMAEFARTRQLWDRAINTAELTRDAHDFTLRFLAPFETVFQRHAQAEGLSEPWVLGVARQESRFVPDIRSSAGAIGLMQLMPSTARLVAQQVGMRAPDLSDVDTNIRLGTRYLRDVFDRLDGQPLLASAAYNAGPGRAERWRADHPLEGAVYAETIPFNETRDYVKRVLANACLYSQVLGTEPLSLKQLLPTVAAR